MRNKNKKMARMSNDTYIKENQSLVDFFMLSEGQQFTTMADKLINVFRNNRDEVNKKIYNSILCMRELRQLVNVQVDMLSLRQRLLEDSHILLDKLVVLRKQYRVQKGDAYDKLLNNIQMRVKTTGEKEAMVEGISEIAEIRHKIEILEGQTSYYNDTIRTVDDILYGIKTRLEIDKLLGAV